MGWVWPFDQVARNNLPNHSLQGGMKHIRWLASNRCPKGLSTSMLKSGKHNMSLLQIYPHWKSFSETFHFRQRYRRQLANFVVLIPFYQGEKSERNYFLHKGESVLGKLQTWSKHTCYCFAMIADSTAFS